MKFYYPVVIEKKEEGSWHAFFPDLKMCEADGTDEFDVLQNAREAAYGWIDLEMQETDPQLPSPTDPKDVRKEPGQDVRMILVNYRLTEGWDE